MERQTQPLRTAGPELRNPDEVSSEQSLLDKLVILKPYFATDERVVYLDELNAQYHAIERTETNSYYVKLDAPTGSFAQQAFRKKYPSFPDNTTKVAARRFEATQIATKRARDGVIAMSRNMVVDLGITDPDNAYDAEVILAEIACLDEDEWNSKYDENGNVIPGVRDKFRALPVAGEAVAASVTEADADPNVTEDTEDALEDTPEVVDPAIEAARRGVDAARKKWAAASAKRQGRLFSTESDSRKEIKDAYDHKVVALGRMELAELLADPEATDDAKNLAVITYLFAEQESLRTLTTEKLQGTSVSGIIEWMNKGRFATRIAKGLGIGIVAGLAGGFVAGAVGAAVVGTGLVATTRFARGFASRDNKKRGMKTTLEDSDRTAVGQSVEAGNLAGTDRFDSALQNLDALFEVDTKKEQSKRRNAAAWGIGSMAVGATIGLGIHFGIEQLVDHNVRVTSLFDNGDTSTGGGHETPTGSDAYNPNNDTIPIKPDVPTPESAPPVTPPVEVVPPIEFSEAAQAIDNGEGWYQTFKDLNIPKSDWGQLLSDTGPKLQELGVAYSDPNIGGYGINMSSDGRMSQEALNYITQTAQEHGYIATSEAVVVAPTDVVASPYDVLDIVPDTEVPDASSTDVVSDGGGSADVLSSMTGASSEAAQTIASGEGWFQTFKEMGLGREHWSQLIKEAGPELQKLSYFDGTRVAYFDAAHQQWHMNMSVSGTLHPKAIELLANMSGKHNWALAA